MKEIVKEITQEQYINATQSNDKSGIFSASELCGYGVFNEFYYKSDNKFYVRYQIGDSCD